MTATVDVIKGETAYSLTDGNPFYRVALNGRGMAPINRLLQTGPQQHGATDVGFRLDSRRINLLLTAQGATRADFDDIRDQLYTIFTPDDTPVTIVYTRDDSEIRHIDVHVIGELDFPESEQVHGSMTWAVPLIAPDPLWYDPEEQTLTLNEDTLTDTIAYSGTFREYPIIVFTGPLEDFVLTQDDSGDVLDFTGFSIGSGVTITVDLRYGYKTVTRGDGTNEISNLTSASNLATWSIPVGGCDVTLSASGMTDVSTVEISYYNRYIGV